MIVFYVKICELLVVAMELACVSEVMATANFFSDNFKLLSKEGEGVLVYGITWVSIFYIFSALPLIGWFGSRCSRWADAPWLLLIYLLLQALDLVSPILNKRLKHIHLRILLGFILMRHFRFKNTDRTFVEFKRIVQFVFAFQFVCFVRCFECQDLLVFRFGFESFH